MVFLKEFFKKVDFGKNQQTTIKHAKLPSRQRVKVQIMTAGNETGLHRLEKYLKIQDCLEKSLKKKIALKSTSKLSKALKSP